MDEERYARMLKLAEEFEGSLGRKLQRYLILKSWWAANYVSLAWSPFLVGPNIGKLSQNKQQQKRTTKHRDRQTYMGRQTERTVIYWV